MFKRVGLGVLLLSLGLSAQASPQREQYRLAEQALAQGKTGEYRQLRQGLDTYPLVPYLDYEALSKRLNELGTGDVRDFMRRYADTPLANRLERRFLFRLAREQRWREFLSLYPELPNSAELQCAHYRAKWATGDKAEAMKGAERLWLHGRSRPDACDPLFEAWKTRGGLNDEQVWQRMLLAYESGQSGLLKYLSGLLGGKARESGDLLVSLDRNPALLADGEGFSSSNPRHQAAMAMALVRLADRDPGLAMTLYPRYQRAPGLTSLQVAEVERSLARRLMFNRTKEYRGWLDKRLPEIGTDALFELRARLAIWEQDWGHLVAWIDRLPADEQNTSRWQYWRGRALASTGKQKEADAAWARAAGEREYYGFLAAQRSQRPFSLNRQAPPAAPDWQQALTRWPGLARVAEWLALGNKAAARSEWYHLLGSVGEADQLALGALALKQGWHDKSILASIRARAWDQLELRFPVVYEQVFRGQANKLDLDESTLFAIARQESAFYEQARSPVGAGGLMQLMPATARETARKHGIRDYQRTSDVYRPEVNVQLGSSYFKELLERYQGNRIPAIAAYNAGPGRINRWLEQSASRPLDVWVENIPYRETRGYVQNVLAYSVIYQDMLGQKKTFITPQELDYVY
ncbi:transglycosylase SLT domain-containing protein [Oceanimonas sp. CHS3-5]|uniref:transglycosylase SLT domain-containing protein n=1 Tax=Oceanimonas sp. CHS3-5 TaxID=3068186 RepID=UPI00273FFF77|nr:transglycosylase SLT domain-containing protein [Oceanimonas sp. CHS3-5]MDP5290753.1 transglycosylase SLT domain-containing protein [Oceanimonas sp. CHS3-5]